MQAEVTRTGWSQPVIFAAGSCCSLLGLVVLFGWYSNRQVFTQITTTLAPMQPNTALSFWLCGLGLLAIVFRWHGLAAVSGLVVLAIDLLTFTQSLFSIDMGIAKESLHLSSMAPTSALCFTMSGLALVAMSWSTLHRHRSMWLGACASILTALALTSLMGYATASADLHRWGQYIHQAPHTALGFLAIGTGVFAFAWHDERSHAPGMPTVLPMLAAIGLLTIALGTWQALDAREHAYIRHLLASEAASARSMGDELVAQWSIQLQALQRMAERWENAGPPAQADWDFEARLNLRDFQGYQAIGWIDPTFHVRWLAPVEGNEFLQDLPLAPHERQRIELATIANRHQVVVGEAIELAHGGKAVMIYIPMFNGEDFGGLMLGMFSVQRLVDSILAARIGGSHSLTIFAENEEIYSRHHAGRPYDGQWGQEITFDLYGVVWRLRLWPDPEALATSPMPLAGAILIAGVVVSALLVWRMSVGQMARQRLRETILINRDLARELIERQRTEQTLHEAAELYRQILDGITDLVFCRDRHSRLVWANTAYSDYYGLTQEQLHDRHGGPCLAPVESRQTLKDDAHVFNTGVPLNIPEERLVRCDGVVHPFHTVKAPIFNADGAVSMLVGVSRHSIEPKRA